MLDSDLRTAMERGIAGLSAMQSADGCFVVTASSQRPPSYAADPIFSTASVLATAGALLPRPTAAAALDFLSKRRRCDGLWAWAGCPADADDLALCLTALITAGSLDASEALLLRQFRNEASGSYRTWPEGFGGEKRPCDPVVNCNALFCLQRSGIATDEKETQAISDLVERAIRSTGRYSSYYRCKSTLLYVGARAGLKPSVLEPLSLALQTEALDAQQAAEILAASQRPDPVLIERLLAAQRDDGSWAGTPWICDRVGDYCSDAYATAVCVEALYRHRAGVFPTGRIESPI